MTQKRFQERLLTPEEVAAHTNVSTVTVGRWLREGKLKGLKAGRQWRIREEDLEKFLRTPARGPISHPGGRYFDLGGRATEVTPEVNKSEGTILDTSKNDD
jgi:excisionase family DNA binding protein